MGTGAFLQDRRTDITKLIVVRNFLRAPKKVFWKFVSFLEVINVVDVKQITSISGINCITSRRTNMYR